MTSSWKEGAVKRKEMQIGQRDAPKVTGANKTRKPKKKDKPWKVEVTYLMFSSKGVRCTFDHYFMHEEDAVKFANKSNSKYARVVVYGPQTNKP